MRLGFSAAGPLLAVSVTMAALGVSAQDIFVTPIPGAPFSAVIKVERSIPQRDGSVVNVKTTRQIGRDSQGRIHNEMRELVPVSSNNPPQLLRIRIYDPQTRMVAVLDAKDQTFWTRIGDRPPAAVPPLFYASPVGNTLPQNEFTKGEDLGVHEINGVLAHGVKEIQEAGNGAGNDAPITDEYWYSEELRINVKVRHSDPRTGTVTMTVDQVMRTEPDPALFEIPKEYHRASPQE